MTFVCHWHRSQGQFSLPNDGYFAAERTAGKKFAQKARHSQSGIQMAEELPLQRAHEAGSTDSRLHHAGLHDVACSVSHSRNITNQMQRRSATKDVARDSGRSNMQHRSK